VLVQAGALFTLVFGIWLAIQVSDYHPWDGWIVAAYVIWALAVVNGRATGQAFARAAEGGPETPVYRRRGILLHSFESVLVLLILLDMIFKPGA
jgi:hypothetical protein